MKKLVLLTSLVIIILSAGLFGGCYRGTEANGKVETRTFDYSDFTAIEVEDAFDVEITYAETYSITVSGAERVMDRLEVSKTGDTLKIELGGWEWFWFWNSSPKAVITLPDLRRLDMGGASEGFVRGFNSTNDFALEVNGASNLEIDMETSGFESKVSGASELDIDLKASSFEIKVSGASTLKGDLETGSTKIELSGASNARLAGSGGDLTLACSGASDANLMNFPVGDADVNLSGASDADVDVSGNLDVTVSGASNLDYYGNPVLGRTDISGSSDINHHTHN